MSNELLVIEKLELVPFFTKGDNLDDTLAKIKAEAMAHVPDVSTLKGRNAIKKNVTMVTKSKTYLENQGKDLAAEYKAIPKAIDANRKKTKDFLTALQEEIREPLTAWEAIDKAEKDQIKDTEVFLIEYEETHQQALNENELIDLRAKQAEADRQAEIKAAEEKAAADAKEIAEAAAAELVAQAERDKIAAEQREIATKQAAIDAENKAAKDAIDAKAREDEAKQAAKNAEWLAYIAEAYSINDRMNAKKQADFEAAQAAEDARLSQIQQQENDQLREDQEQRQREENKRFVGGIKTKVMNDLVTHCGLSQDVAKQVVIAMAKGQIRNAKIIYK